MEENRQNPPDGQRQPFWLTLREDPASRAVLIAFLTLLAYVIIHPFKGKTPDFMKAIGVFASCAGLIASVHILWAAIFAPRHQLGVFGNDRLLAASGAILFAWVAAETIVKAFLQLFV
jgi:hypothetical protein